MWSPPTKLRQEATLSQPGSLLHVSTLRNVQRKRHTQPLAQQPISKKSFCGKHVSNEDEFSSQKDTLPTVMHRRLGQEIIMNKHRMQQCRIQEIQGVMFIEPPATKPLCCHLFPRKTNIFFVFSIQSGEKKKYWQKKQAKTDHLCLCTLRFPHIVTCSLPKLMSSRR